ncbi:D-sedoheptulose 7-phosphate isomerase [Synechococcus sp. A15-127]|uniref:SIS domain-containing protein n=1 Tax=Synechococcus sp. A15-127 TaxID=1050624 RepID=UPI001644E3A1|nr:SIS domain-containing protein [Synechococcus sp. A15-127]QNI95445.1 D-sedoheptulose 7-phosphate isomerase [Synechococcus sp. A15-127]
MTASSTKTVSFVNGAFSYLERLQGCFNKTNLEAVEHLAKELREAWIDGRNVYICGNGGSAANAIHVANDLHYGIGACGTGAKLPGLRIEALSANSGVVTCLANDTGYENIYSHQIEVKGRQGDILIALSGSGNSPNIVKVLEAANQMSIKTYAIIAFNGGRCKDIAKKIIHFEINDMQVAEDTQLVVGHLCMQWLNSNKPSQLNPLKNG